MYKYDMCIKVYIIEQLSTYYPVDPFLFLSPELSFYANCSYANYIEFDIMSEGHFWTWMGQNWPLKYVIKSICYVICGCLCS